MRDKNERTVAAKLHLCLTVSSEEGNVANLAQSALVQVQAQALSLPISGTPDISRVISAVQPLAGQIDCSSIIAKIVDRFEVVHNLIDSVANVRYIPFTTRHLLVLIWYILDSSLCEDSLECCVNSVQGAV